MQIENCTEGSTEYSTGGQQKKNGINNAEYWKRKQKVQIKGQEEMYDLQH
jgi:hypothetical protein